MTLTNTRPTPPARAPVDPRVRERWIALRRAEGRRRLHLLLAVLGVLAVLASGTR